MPGYVSAIDPKVCYYTYGKPNSYWTSDKWMPIYSNSLLSEQPADRELAQGNQSGYGRIFSGLVETPDGTICGKAHENRIWWTYSSTKEEWQDGSFNFLEGWDVNNSWDMPTPQGSSGNEELWAAICNTENGWVPGYVFSNAPQACYYAWYQEESSTEYILIYSDVTSTEMEGKAQGFQTLFGDIYSVLIETEFGLLPAKGMNGECWWSWNGVSYRTTDTSKFKYILGF